MSKAKHAMHNACSTHTKARGYNGQPCGPRQQTRITPEKTSRNLPRDLALSRSVRRQMVQQGGHNTDIQVLKLGEA
jgi:hypothetical protein